MNDHVDAPELDRLLIEAVERQDLPFVVAMVADREGLLWQGRAGHSRPTSQESTHVCPVEHDAVFRMFSQTKAIGAAAAMILVDRGLLTLDTPVSSVLPEFDQVRVLQSLGPDGPVWRAPRTACTLRHLLTHTSGLSYEGLDDRMTAFREASPAPAAMGTMENLLGYPMIFDPGTEFAYGVGMDWVGLIIERVDGRSVDQFCQDELFEPLGMADTFFEPDGHEDRVPALRQRAPDGSFRVVDVAAPPRPEYYSLGICLYGTAADYLRFLQMVLNGGQLDGRRVLSTRAIELMTSNQMPDGVTVRPLVSTDRDWSADVDLVPGRLRTHTSAFMRNEETIDGMRAAGSLTWAGIFNTHYWVDPTNGLAAVFMTQSLPFNEPRLARRYEEFERAVYRQFVDTR